MNQKDSLINLFNCSAGNQVFDLSSLNSGQYVVRVEMDRGIKVSKLIKLKLL